MNARTIGLAIGLLMAAGTAWGQENLTKKTSPDSFRWSLQFSHGPAWMDGGERWDKEGKTPLLNDDPARYLSSTFGWRRGTHLRSVKYARINHQGAEGTTIDEVSFQMGLIRKGRWGYISISSGISFLAVKKALLTEPHRNTIRDIITIHTLGIPLELRALTTPIPVIGIGFGLQGNLNPQRSYVGFSVVLEFGDLR